MTLSEFDVWFRTRFRKTSSAPTIIIFILSDLLGIMLSFGLGFIFVEAYGWIIVKYSGFINLRSFVTYWPYLPVFIIIFQIIGLYPGISLAPSEELRRFSIGSLMAYGGVILSRVIENQGWDQVNAAFTISLFFSAFVLLTFRSMIHWLLRKIGMGGIPAVVYGSGSTARHFIDRTQSSTKMGYMPALILDDEATGAEEYKGIPIIHDTNIGPEIVKRYNIKMAIVAMDQKDTGKDKDKLKQLLEHSVSAFRYHVIIPDFFDRANIWMSVRDFDGLLGFVTSIKLGMPWNLGIKRFIDIFLVIVGGIIVLPALLFVALLVKLTSPGPVLYGHKRMGRNGKPFYALKFRSMATDANERLEKLLETNPDLKKEWEENHKLKVDPRVTKLGKFLRRTSIDEFPQLINILKGEMSLVGPRPITEGEVEKYGEDFSWIFSVRPGLTGLWQVSGRSETDYTSRVSYDTYYLQSWSLWLDLWVIYKTFGVVLHGKGAY
ncbi:MAG: undecaprenyl-phosphate galactose phosphotransferase WbaP [Treponema sp.]|nr:undecaprenyl-phosphate galactose phosphotransferase WbaP [Treponema sp.]